MKPQHSSLGRIIAATKYSKNGLIATFRDEAAFRQELSLYLIFLPLLILLPFSLLMKMLLLLANTLVLICELLNTSIEAVVDMVSPDYHDLAKKAKDCGSAAVFSSLILSLALWITAACSLFFKL